MSTFQKKYQSNINNAVKDLIKKNVDEYLGKLISSQISHSPLIEN
jgi:hypothetical protein